jgi:signal peptidase II
MYGSVEAALTMTRTVFLGLLSASVALFTDQVTKSVVVAYASVLSAGVKLFSGFDLVFLRNDGVSFGMLGNAPWWALVCLALGICSWMAWQMLRAESRIEALAYGAVIGGALGNVMDRLRFQAVTDFLGVHIGALHWPAFNLADVFIVSGVAVLLASTLWSFSQDQA